MCASIPVATLALGAEVWLADRGRVRIRPIALADAAALQAFIRGLSVQSSRRRFLRPVRELTPQMLARVVEVDYSTSISLVAEARSGIVGLAQYVADPDPGVAEVALVVADEWQRAGLGRRLFGALIAHAFKEGIARLEGDVLADNRPMRALAARCGFRIRPSCAEAGLVRMVRELPARGRPKASFAAAFWDWRAGGRSAVTPPARTEFRSTSQYRSDAMTFRNRHDLAIAASRADSIDASSAASIGAIGLPRRRSYDSSGSIG